MNQGSDEPLFPGGGTPAPSGDTPLRGRIESLVLGQPYAVLSTQGEGQPYASLIAVRFREDLREVVFATPRTTRKYRLLAENPRMALLVDDRSREAATLMDLEAVTVTGNATEVPRGPEHARLAGFLLGRHPNLEDFLEAPTCALFRVAIRRFFHVRRFQEVQEWIPAAP